jgi:chorismate mutase / prephenate dehydratase
MTMVAIQGIKGSYSEEAVRKLLGDAVSILECSDFADTFAALDRGEADHAVVPVANKIVGAITQPAELIKAGRFQVVEKLSLKVRHVLAGTPDSKIEDLVSVRSHVEALKQCRRFLSGNPNLTQIIGGDTATSIRRIVDEGDPTSAAIGSRRAAELYGAKILREDIADDIDNWTTFYLVGN